MVDQMPTRCHWPRADSVGHKQICLQSCVPGFCRTHVVSGAMSQVVLAFWGGGGRQWQVTHDDDAV